MKMLKKIFAFSIVLIILFSMMPVHVHATSIDNVEITGTYSDKFILNVANEKLFDIAIMNPGDVWENDIEIKNDTGYDMEVRLEEVVNKIEDTMLFDVLNVTIIMNGEVIYEGPYNSIPASEWVTVKNGETLVFTVILEFPAECGNEYQNKNFDSNWKFAARLPDGVGKEPEDPDVQTGVARTLYIGAGVCIGAAILIFLLRDKEEDKKKK